MTQSQSDVVMRTTPWRGAEHVKDGPGYPATHVSWDEVVAFCKEISRREGATYRLPAEAEWEYAYRAGTTKSFILFICPARPLLAQSLAGQMHETTVDLVNKVMSAGTLAIEESLKPFGNRSFDGHAIPLRSDEQPGLGYFDTRHNSTR